MVRGAANLLIGTISLLGIIGGGWLAVNYQPSVFGFIFVFLSLTSLVVAAFSGQIARFFGGSASISSGSFSSLQLKKQFVIGFILGWIPIVLTLAQVLSIGIPVLSVQSNIQAFISIILAPIVEEAFFLFLVPFLLGLMFQRFGKAGFVLNLFVSSFIFSSYHWLAYGAEFLVGSAFIGAFVFRFLTILIVAWLSQSTNFTPQNIGRGIVAAIIMHFMFNSTVYARQLLIVPQGVIG